ncbi:hypothetical protein NW754_005539 [Fusarium falciforme]|nr:hypothetical protein NW754_005539 [Fusarium falciforme]
MRFTNSFFTAVAALASAVSAGNMGVANILAITGPSGGQHTEKTVTVPFGQLTHYEMAISELRLESIAVTLPRRRHRARHPGHYMPDVQGRAWVGSWK